MILKPRSISQSYRKEPRPILSLDSSYLAHFVGSLLCGPHIIRKSQRDNLITKIVTISENILLHGNPPAAV